jgi:hypothetical protein
MRALALALALALLPLIAGAAEDEDKVEPDRASLSTGTNTVRRGAAQLEVGFNYGHERMAGAPTEKRFGLETALRVGVAGGLEIGVSAEPLVRLRGPVDDTGNGDFTLLAKYRFFDPPEGSPWPSLGVQPYVKLPVAEEPFGSGKTDFGANLLASFELPGRIGFDVNAGLSAIGQNQPSGYLLQALVAAGLSRDFGGAFTLFTDLLYTSREERDGRDTLLLDGGLVYYPARNVALDASVVTSLAGNAPDWTVRAGISVRFGR